MAENCLSSWKSFDPDMLQICHDDAACDRFLSRWFDGEVLDMFRSLPIGVMKADVWRVAVIYVYGGIYADVDVESLGAVSRWIDEADSFVAAIENGTGAIGNFVFAAKPRHPVLGLALAKMLAHYRSESFLSSESPTPVQDFGAGAFSDAVIEYYGIPFAGQVDSRRGGVVYPGRRLGESARIYGFDERILSPYLVDSTLVYHKTASVFWVDRYHSWRLDQERLLGVFGG